MNDMRIPQAGPPSFFTIERREEVIDTHCFGRVTVHEVPALQIQAIHAKYTESQDDAKFGYLLLCATATGEQGERFRLELFDELPVRAFEDVGKLVAAAVRINGKETEVEKP
jgi:hypothetical protein